MTCGAKGHDHCVEHSGVAWYGSSGQVFVMAIVTDASTSERGLATVLRRAERPWDDVRRATHGLDYWPLLLIEYAFHGTLVLSAWSSRAFLCRWCRTLPHPPLAESERWRAS